MLTRAMNPRNKAEWRRYFTEHKMSLSASEQEAKSEQLNQHLSTSSLFNRAHTIALFYSISPEPNLNLIIEEARSRGKSLFLPRFDTHIGGYRFVPWRLDDGLESGPYNIPQPKEQPSECPCLDLILVPGLAFDLEGNRLGHGAGIYDRLLAKENTLPIGVAFDYQRVSELPHESHDRAMGYVVSESGLHRT